MRFEHRRARLVFHLGKLKLEWTIEPRYWRNPLLAVSFLLLLPLLLSLVGRADYMSLITSANVYAAVAIPLAWQMTGIGRMNFGPQFFMGLGGFAAGLLSIHLGWGPWQTLGVVILFSASVGLLLSPLTTLAQGLYFSLITLILPLMLLELTMVFTTLLGGEVGLSGIKPLFEFGSIHVEQIVSCYFSLLMMLVFLYIVDKTMRSRIGLFAAAINDEENVAEACGLNIKFWKMLCFVITSTMVGIAGWFLAHNDGVFAGSTVLPLTFMIKILLVVIIGGRGALYGCIVGAYFVAVLEKVLVLLGAVNYILFPLVLLILLFTLKEGLYGLYRQHKYREYYPTMRVRKR